MSKVMIFYDYFTPAYKAGGPIRSLHNLVSTVSNFEFLIVCSNRDLDGTELQVESDKWIDFNPQTKVWYSGNNKVRDLIKTEDPDVLYINGIFSIPYNLNSLIAAGKRKVVIAPRGMLQEGAIRSKGLKKKLYLIFFRTAILRKSIIWQATDEQEIEDIKSHIGENVEVRLATNVPAAYLIESEEITKKQVGLVRLCYLSLISEKKNLKWAVEQLLQRNSDFQLDIYGPVKDHGYWNQINPIIESDPRINYKGDVIPSEISSVLSEYHFFILPTKGENFGHAIFEALATGTPAIITNKTPWKELESKHAGFTFCIEDKSEFKRVIDSAVEMDNEEYQKWSKGAKRTAIRYVEDNDYQAQYERLFA